MPNEKLDCAVQQTVKGGGKPWLECDGLIDADAGVLDVAAYFAFSSSGSEDPILPVTICGRLDR